MKTTTRVLAVVVSILLCAAMLTSCGLDSLIGNFTTVMECNEVKVTKNMMTFFVNDYISAWYAEYSNYYGNYYNFLQGSQSMISLDLSKDLKDQKITREDVSYLGDESYVGRTWYDYFSDRIVEKVETYVIYANAANAAGIALSAEDKNEIERIVEDLKDTLEYHGTKISDVYGKGVTESDIRKCYELIYLASAFAEYNEANIEASLREDYQKVEEFRDEHKEKYCYAKCLTYSISVSERKFASSSLYDAAVESAKLTVEKIANAENAEEFIKLIEERQTENGTAEERGTENVTAKDDKLEFEAQTSQSTSINGNDIVVEFSTGVNDQPIYSVGNGSLGNFVVSGELSDVVIGGMVSDTVIGGALSGAGSILGSHDFISPSGGYYGHNDGMYQTTILYNTDDEIGQWLFDEYDPVSVGDVKIIEETGTEQVLGVKKPTNSKSEDASESETESGESENKAQISLLTYKTYTATVYMVITPPTVNETNTHDFAYLVTTDKNAAESFIRDFKSLNSGEKSKEGFCNLADEYYNDNFANHAHTDDEDFSEPIFSYGNLDNAKENYFDNNFSKMNEWLDDDDRRNGDFTGECIKITVGSGKNETTYYAVLYFERHDIYAWYVDASADLTQMLIAEWYEGELEKDLITFDADAFDGIEIVRYHSNNISGGDIVIKIEPHGN